METAGGVPLSLVSTELSRPTGIGAICDEDEAGDTLTWHCCPEEQFHVASSSLEKSIYEN